MFVPVGAACLRPPPCTILQALGVDVFLDRQQRRLSARSDARLSSRIFNQHGPFLFSFTSQCPVSLSRRHEGIANGLGFEYERQQRKP